MYNFACFWTSYSEIKLSIGFCILLLSFNSVLVRSIHAALYLCGVFLLLNSFPGTRYVSNCLLTLKWTFHLVSIFRNNVTLDILIYEFMVDTQELLCSILLTVEALIVHQLYIFMTPAVSLFQVFSCMYLVIEAKWTILDHWLKNQYNSGLRNSLISKDITFCILVSN